VPVDARTFVAKPRAMVWKSWARMHAEPVLRPLILLASEESLVLDSSRLLLDTCCWLNVGQLLMVSQVVAVGWAGKYVSNDNRRQAC
jgi:hypothetical protein